MEPLLIMGSTIASSQVTKKYVKYAELGGDDDVTLSDLVIDDGVFMPAELFED